MGMQRRSWPLALLGLVALTVLARPPYHPSIFIPTPMKLQPMTAPDQELSSVAAVPGVAEPNPAAPVPPESAEPGVDPEAWRRSPVLRSLVWLAQHQNEDGSWGDGPVTVEGHTLGKAGVTALALMAFVGQGYSHYSKDEYDGKIIGRTLRRAVDWLVRDLGEDGRFGSVCDGGFDQALTTFAISDYYAMTVASFMKEPVERAALALNLMQSPDGSWGSPATSAWALKALCSVEFNELPVDADVRSRALQYASAASHPGIVSSRILLTKDRLAEQSSVQALAAAPLATDDLSGWYHTADGLYLAAGSGGKSWQAWKDGMRTAVLGQQGSDGTWFGGTLSNTVARSSYALLTLEIYYRYSPGLALR